MVTAIKRAEEDPSRLIVRFFNISDEPVRDARVFVRNTVNAQVVNLNEEEARAVDLQADGSVALEEIRPKEIVTLAFGVRE